MSSQLPDYELSLHKAKLNEDQAAHVTVHNMNAEEIVEYVNALRNYIAESISTETEGITSQQAKAIVESQKYMFSVPVVWSSLTLPMTSDNVQVGTMTRTNNADGSVRIVMTNVKNTTKVLVQVQNFEGVVVNPKITITNTFITLFFNRREDLDPTPGYSDQNTDPNIKRVIIF